MEYRPDNIIYSTRVYYIKFLFIILIKLYNQQRSLNFDKLYLSCIFVVKNNQLIATSNRLCLIFSLVIECYGFKVIMCKFPIILITEELK